MPVARMFDVWRDRARHDTRAAATKSGRDRHVLFAVRCVRDWESLDRGSQPRLPQHVAGLHVVRAEVAIEVAYENNTTARRQRSREIRSALLATPDFLHRGDVIGRQLSDVAI